MVRVIERKNRWEGGLRECNNSKVTTPPVLKFTRSMYPPFPHPKMLKMTVFQGLPSLTKQPN